MSFINNWLQLRRDFIEYSSQLLPLSNLRQLAEEECKVFTCRKFLGEHFVSKSQLKIIPEYLIQENDFKTIAKPLLEYDDNYPPLFSIFSAPHYGILPNQNKNIEYCESIGALLRHRNINEKFIIRSGFFEHEYDIWESLALGFDAILVYVKNLDAALLQLFTEIGRDYKASIIAVIDSPQALRIALATDVPYLCLLANDLQTEKINLPFLTKILPQIPTNCLSLAWTLNISEPNALTLQKMGITAIIS